MTKEEFLYHLDRTIFIPTSKKERIKYWLSIGDFTSIRLSLDKIIDEIDETINRMSNRQLVVNTLNKQKTVCNSMMDYVINMIEISYNMKRDDGEGENVRRTINSSS